MMTVRCPLVCCLLVVLGGGASACGAAAEDEPGFDEDVVSSEDAISIGLQCVVQDRVVGQCGPDAAMLEPCTSKFGDACKAIGGTIGPCGGGACESSVFCHDDSPLLHDCDKDFKAACRKDGGTFECVTVDCGMGKCTFPDG